MPMRTLKKVKIPSYLEKIAELIKKSVDLIEIKFSQVPGLNAPYQQGVFSIQVSQTEEEKKVAPVWDIGEIARFSLIQLPGCCGVVVSTGASVSEKYRKLGIGKLLCEMRSHIAFRWNYSLMHCTDVTTNKPQQAILKDLGWKKNLEFVNCRTKNTVALHTISPKQTKNYQLGFELADDGAGDKQS